MSFSKRLLANMILLPILFVAGIFLGFAMLAMALTGMAEWAWRNA